MDGDKIMPIIHTSWNEPFESLFSAGLIKRAEEEKFEGLDYIAYAKSLNKTKDSV